MVELGKFLENAIDLYNVITSKILFDNEYCNVKCTFNYGGRSNTECELFGDLKEKPRKDTFVTLRHKKCIKHFGKIKEVS